jgi:uncharacterized lipoprotein YmbA
MESKLPASRAALAAALLIAAAGCGSSPPSRFYLLAATGEPAVEPERAREQGPFLHVGPVLLPDYLERDQIVTRVAGSRLVLGEYDRWAEPVEKGFMRVLVQVLARELPDAQVVSEPSGPGGPRYRLAVDVLQFDVSADRRARLEVRWSLQDLEQDASIARRATYVRPAGADGYEEAVAALGATIADMARDVASAVRAPRAAGG